MKERKRFFDDRVFYDPVFDKIWIGRPDTKTESNPWEWWFTNGDQTIRQLFVPRSFIEIAREYEFSVC